MKNIQNSKGVENDVRQRIKRIIKEISKNDIDEKKLTHKEIAKATGFTVTAVQKMLSGKYHLTHLFIERFANEYIEGDICYLYTGITDPTKYEELSLSSDCSNIESTKEGYSLVELKFIERLKKKYHTMNDVANRFGWSSATLYELDNHQQNLTMKLTVKFANKGIDIAYLLTGINGLKENEVLNSIKHLSRDEQIRYLKSYRKPVTRNNWLSFK